MASSRSMPSLERSSKSNWVEQTGGLPDYIERIAKHLHYEKGMTISHAIATAKNVVERMCETGDTNWPGIQHVSPKSRAQACKALAEWNAKRAKAKATPNAR